MWFIGVEVEQETSALPPKKNPGSAPDVIVVGKWWVLFAPKLPWLVNGICWVVHWTLSSPNGYALLVVSHANSPGARFLVNLHVCQPLFAHRKCTIHTFPSLYLSEPSRNFAKRDFVFPCMASNGDLSFPVVL